MVSINWWCIAYHDLKKIWNYLLFKLVHLVVIFLKQKLNLVLTLLLKANRYEALRTRYPVCCNCRDLFTPSMKPDVHPCLNITSIFTKKFLFQKEVLCFFFLCFGGEGDYCCLFICQNNLYLFFTYVMYMYNFLIAVKFLEEM